MERRIRRHIGSLHSTISPADSGVLAVPENDEHPGGVVTPKSPTMYGHV